MSDIWSVGDRDFVTLVVNIRLGFDIEDFFLYYACAWTSGLKD